MSPISAETRSAIQRHFHDVIRGRAGNLVDEHNLTLPDLASLAIGKKHKVWFAVPGMFGGFEYWLEGEGEQGKLICASWCRVVEGSGERHQVTAEGSKLLEEGFV